MNCRVPCPLSARLAPKVEDHAEGAEKDRQAHVEHDGLHCSPARNPAVDELAETVSPDILVDGDCDEDGSCHWFVAVDGIGGDNGGNGRDLKSTQCVSNDDNNLQTC